MRALFFLASFASLSFQLPYVSQTVYGAAETTAKVGDTVRVGIFVDQTDVGLTEFFVAIPYNPSLLEYKKVEGDGLTAFNAKATATQASINVTWKGTLEEGADKRLGFVDFVVKKADRSTFKAAGVNPSAKDKNGASFTDIVVLQSEASVKLAPRPLRVQMELTCLSDESG